MITPRPAPDFTLLHDCLNGTSWPFAVSAWPDPWPGTYSLHWTFNLWPGVSSRALLKGFEGGAE